MLHIRSRYGMPANFLLHAATNLPTENFRQHLRPQTYTENKLARFNRLTSESFLLNEPWKLLLLIHAHRPAQQDQHIE
ncbi:hypothetical protein D3C85_1734470 [compost metagenome]